MNRTLAWLIPVAVLLGTPLATAGSSQGEFVSDSPVLLQGTGTVVGPSTLFHHAFRDGSLTGVTYSATLSNHTVLEVPDAEAQGAECRTLHGRGHSQTLATVNVSRPEDRAEFHLRQGALARLTIGLDLRFAISSVGQPGQAEARPFAHLGPNPYRYQTAQDSTGAEGDVRLAPAFPMSEFVVAPDGIFYTDAKNTMTVEWGTLAFVQKGRTTEFHAGQTRETRTVPSELLQGVPSGTTTCQVDVTQTLTLQIQLATLAIDQAGLDRSQAFWRGAQALGSPLAQDRPAPPRGYWYRSDASAFGAAQDAYALPATVVASEPMKVQVEGTLRLQHALGSLAVNNQLREASNETVTVGGSLRLEPNSADEGGRRMRTHVGGDVVTFNEEKDPRLPPLAAYAWGGIGGFAVLAGAFYTWPSIKYGATKFLLFPLYARLRKEDILENPLRDDIVDVVNSEPGISASELGRRLTCGWGTLVYHLTVLEKMQLISSHREGRHKRFFVQGRINYSDKAAVGLLANPAARNILLAVQEAPGIIQRDLALRLSLTAGTIAWHVERLAAAGLVVKEEDGRVVRYFPSSKLAELTRQLGA